MSIKKHRIMAVMILTTTALCACLSRQFEAGNRIDLRVSANVGVTDSVFLYAYVLANGDTAKQEIYKFDIIPAVGGVLTRMQSPVDWRGIVFRETRFKIRWIARAGASGFKAAIRPSTRLTGFAFSTRSLPSIVTYYAEGNHELPRFDEGMAPDSIPGYTDLTPYGPGVVGRTVGPVLPPDPFDPVGFLDTLLSYTAQAASLGWITGQTTTDKYIGYFTSGKTSLQNSNVSAARATLRQVLRDANVDSTSTLTSEAYALLRYNTEYLLSKLPAPPAITALNPSMSIVGSSAFTLTVSGTNFEQGSTVNWNGSGRTTTFVADTVLRASILAPDVAVVGSPAVTVRNADGSESDAVRFYVISAVAWVDTVISYKHKAFSLGWIDDAGVANSLDQKLDNARKQLEQGNNKAAKNILEAFVNEVEAQKGKHISGEAYALLKPNVAYLISKL